MVEEPVSDEERDELTIVYGQRMRRLIEYPEWETFVEMMETRIKMEEGGLLRPAGEFGDVFAFERAKGAISAIRLSLSQPRLMVEEAERLQAAKLEEEGDDT